jgi:hypothetical protein
MKRLQRDVAGLIRRQRGRGRLTVEGADSRHAQQIADGPVVLLIREARELRSSRNPAARDRRASRAGTAVTRGDRSACARGAAGSHRQAASAPAGAGAGILELADRPATAAEGARRERDGQQQRGHGSPVASKHRRGEHPGPPDQ